MHLKYKKYDLKLAHPFRIARGAESISTVLIIGIRDGSLCGWGEACPGTYYGDSIANAEAVFDREMNSPLPDRADLAEYCRDLRSRHPESPSARAAIETAMLDLYSQSTNEPLYKYLNLPSTPPVTSSFTIGIDEPGMIEQKLREAADFPLLKIKLGGGKDEETLTIIRKHTDKLLRVDANCGWNKEEAARKSEWLAKNGVEFIEQPLDRDDLEGYQWLRERSALPIILDESVQNYEDFEKFEGAAHGVNIKLMKMGGMCESLKIMHRAKQSGLKIMIGCLIESAVSITAAVHLSPLADYLDLDGNILISEDPCEGVHAYKGKIDLPQIPGLSAYPKDWETWWR